MGGQCQTRYVIEERWEGGNSYCGVCVESLLQRIEAWWGIFRKWNSDWWIEFFKARPN